MDGWMGRGKAGGVDDMHIYMYGWMELVGDR